MRIQLTRPDVLEWEDVGLMNDAVETYKRHYGFEPAEAGSWVQEANPPPQ